MSDGAGVADPADEDVVEPAEAQPTLAPTSVAPPPTPAEAILATTTTVPTTTTTPPRTGHDKNHA